MTLAMNFNTPIRAECATSILTLLILFTTGLVSNLVAANNVNGQPQDTYIQRPDTAERPQLMVAIYCGSSSSKSASLYYNQYLEIESKKWRTDRDATAFCTQDRQEVLNYCRKVYPNHDVRNIVESSRPYKIENWCKLGISKRKCRTRLTVKPYRCLEGTFQSDALLVPERCLFDHVHNKSVCASSDNWNKTATENCHMKSMKLQSYAMLQPCGIGVFSGVEFVCCPQDSQQINSETRPKDTSDGNSFAQAANAIMNWPAKDSKYDSEGGLNNIKTSDDSSRKHHEKSDTSGRDDAESEDDEEDEYDEEDDEYDDDSTSWNNDKGSSSTSAPTTTTTTTTTTTERPVDHYLSHFDLTHEHDDFRKAELAVEGSYRDKITHVMKEWSQLDGRYEEMKKKDPQAAEDFKKKMTHQFRKTIEALEEEGAAQRHQLASMHAERAMAIINRRKKAAMDCLTQALDKIPIHTRQVERCIVKLLRALEKDRSHTLRQYKNLLILNTREALREKKIILEHLVTLNRAANQSIAMLDRSPALVDRLKNKIVTLWHKLRNVPLDEPILRESELKIMEKYEEEVAQRKIERERQRLIEQEAVQDAPQESPSSSSAAETQKTNSPKQVISELSSGESKSIVTSPDNKEKSASQIVVPSSKPEVAGSTAAPVDKHEAPIIQSASSRSASPPHNVHDISIENEIHYQIDSAKFSHLKVDPTHHELSYSIKREPISSQTGFGYPTLLVSACTLVILIAFFGMRHYSKNSNRAYRRQGFAEVGRSCPEEKNVTSMQFNGYENPAYKFFEAEA